MIESRGDFNILRLPFFVQIITLTRLRPCCIKMGRRLGISGLFHYFSNINLKNELENF